MPSLTHAREAASVCTLAENVYVYGGKNKKEFNHSIEVLSNPAACSTDLSAILKWSVIEFSEDFGVPGYNAAFVALNTDELIIFEGINNPKYDEGLFIFNTKTHELQKKELQSKKTKAMKDYTNQSFNVCEN